MGHEAAVFGGGCFWCTEAAFLQLEGVLSVAPGYAGGHDPRPNYDTVCSGRTGHAEVIRIEFDPARISYGDLLAVFFASHDPTTLNRQGNDVGTQYRSIVLYATPEQKTAAEDFISELNRSGKAGGPVVTEVKPLGEFHVAENYHHDYFARNPGNPYCQVVVAPKVSKVRDKFKTMLKRRD